ncbi:ABC transporter permease [Alteromonas sp. BMJM2]|uniref:ABC transporter permease n=1 Tax=Alteromonas sp. BMJM2 TaxID=2954241 RepID=UPI0022B4839D|nr:ABC transporter permease [Alteromonas sp. BMJM2]
MKTVFELSSDITTILCVEALKVKRSPVLMMVVALPFLVIIFSLGLALKSADLSLYNSNQWTSWWANVNALWCYFMMPLLVALITGAINGNEHKNHTWRLMLALPVNLTIFYVSKLFLSLLFVIVSTFALWFFGLLATLIMYLFGALFDVSYGYTLLVAIPKIVIASLPILVIQHFISWRLNSMIGALAVGVVATMGIVQIGSSEYWVYFPWSYMLMASMSTSVALQEKAVWLSLFIAIVLFVFSLKFISQGKRAG